MTENVPASAPQEQPAPQPIAYWRGQPISPEAAAAERAKLIGDEAYTKALLAGDQTKSKELADLWQIAKGRAPAGPSTVADIEKQTVDRVELARLTHAAALRSSAEFSDRAVEQIVGLRPIPQAEREIAQQRLAAMQRDEAFVKRYLAGDRQAALEYKAAAICAHGMPVGSLEDIRRWEAAHSSSAQR